MWRGGDITVLPLKNAFKSSYPDRGTITLKLVSHDIKACFA